MIAPGLKVGLSSSWQVILPGRLEGGAGRLERLARTAALLAGTRARLKTTQPLSLRLSVRITDDRRDMDIAIIDEPAIFAVGVAAAAKVGHRRI
jgi:hypothetical protein